MNHEDLLASTPLFSSLNADEKRELLRLADSFSFPAGTVIFEQGDTADGMYVLERGKVQLWTRFLGEEQLALAQVSAGDVLGEFGLIDRGARSATAEVVDSAQGHFFSLRRFELLYADRRPAARKTMRELRLSLCQRLRSASTELGESPPAFYEYTQRRMRPSPPTAPVRSPASALDLSRLRVLPFFGQFSIPALQSLLAPLSVWTLPRGHVLFSDGDPRGSAFATVRGAVEVVAGRGNEWRRQAILGPGRLFGLVAPLDGGPRETGAVVRESAVVLEIPESELQAHVQKEGPTSETLVDTMHAALSVALRATNRTLLAQSAMGRIARREKRSRVTGSP